VSASVATSGDRPKTHLLRYRGDVTGSIQSVLGGSAMVIEKRYDAETNTTLVEVARLVDPMSLLMRGASD
jgi:methyl coenzyme M reductase gamma subunit